MCSTDVKVPSDASTKKYFGGDDEAAAAAALEAEKKKLESKISASKIELMEVMTRIFCT